MIRIGVDEPVTLHGNAVHDGRRAGRSNVMTLGCQIIKNPLDIGNNKKLIFKLRVNNRGIDLLLPLGNSSRPPIPSAGVDGEFSDYQWPLLWFHRTINYGWQSIEI